MSRTAHLAWALNFLVLCASCSAEPPGLKVGDPAPAWSSLHGVDDKQHALADYSSAKLLVLAFTCNHCPVAKAYEDRLTALAKDYQDKGVQVVAINCNNLPADKLDKMKERAKEKGFTFPYLYDASQKTGRDYGARVTPHLFVLDAARKIAYIGAMDDNQTVKEVKATYLRDALDSLLAGKTPSRPVTKAVGCSIKYEKL